MYTLLEHLQVAGQGTLATEERKLHLGKLNDLAEVTQNDKSMSKLRSGQPAPTHYSEVPHKI